MTSDGYPLGADCDLDALVEWRHRELDKAIAAAIGFAQEMQRIMFPWLPPIGSVDAILAPLSVKS